MQDVVADAFERIGGVDGLVAWAKQSNRNRALFYALAGKLVPGLSAEERQKLRSAIDDDLR